MRAGRQAGAERSREAPTPRAGAGRERATAWIALVLAALLPAAACLPRLDEQPNIIVLLVDALRADHLGFHEYPGRISPHLDELAAESVVFDNCFSQAPWTPPSMGTLFTSLYPEVHGLHRFKDQHFLDPESGRLRTSVLPDEAVTLAERLRDAGYRTAAFIANPWLGKDWGLGQGFEHYDDSRADKRTPATALTDAARKWLEEQPQPEPFFLYLHFMDVHEPYESPEADFRVLWEHLAHETTRPLHAAELPPDHMELRPPWADDAMRRRLAYWKARYAAGVRQFDRRVAGFLDDLRRSGILDRSYLIVTSDHGEELGWGHGKSLHDHQLRVPLMIRRPGGEGRGERIDRYVRLIDLMPSFLALAGAAVPPGLQGTDISPLLRGAPVPAPSEVFATGVLHKPDMFTVRTERYKLVVDGGERTLFDLAADPGETNDVSDERASVAAEMHERLSGHLERSSAAAGLPARTADIPEELRERLRALGYLGE
jgi:arylsulfatase A-like enzyme